MVHLVITRNIYKGILTIQWTVGFISRVSILPAVIDICHDVGFPLWQWQIKVDFCYFLFQKWGSLFSSTDNTLNSLVYIRYINCNKTNLEVRI